LALKSPRWRVLRQLAPPQLPDYQLVAQHFLVRRGQPFMGSLGALR